MKTFKKIILSVFVGLISGILFAGAILCVRLYLDGKLPRGTIISGVDVSFLTKESAIEKLKSETEDFLNTQIALKLKDKTATSDLKNLGVKFSIEDGVKNLETIASKSQILPNFTMQGEKHYLKAVVDKKALIKELDAKLQIKEFYPKLPIFYPDGAKLLVKNGESGYVIKEQKLLNEISKQAKTLSAQDLNLELTPASPEKSKEDVEALRAEIVDKLDQVIQIEDPIYSDDWYIRPLKHIDWTAYSWEEKDDGTKYIKISLTADALNKFLDENVSKWLDRAPQEVNISKDETGKIKIEGEGIDGTKIKRDEFMLAMNAAVNEKTNKITVPIEVLVPKISVSQDLRDIGIKERISVGHTSYYGSPANRKYNIDLGSSKFNGVIIKPDETFSFNKTLGRVDGSNGYRKELVIKQEGTIPEFGGGICQISTTAYRAILFAGLPVVERNEHTYAVSYYSQILGHGLDATIYLGGADLRFKNDTGNAILIQTAVRNDYELYFIFYGTSDGRSVAMKGPQISGHTTAGEAIYEKTADLPAGQKKQVEKRHNGFNVLWTRTITAKDGTQKTENITTHYKAVPDKFLVGEGETTKDPSIQQTAGLPSQ